MPDRLIRKSGLKAVQIAEDGGLMIVLLSTLVAGAQEIWLMIQNQEVRLEDLLLLFIYIEVVSMVKVYWEAGQLPVRMPLYIAIVAMARYLIIDIKNVDGLRIVAIAGAALILAMTVFVVRYGHIKFPYPRKLRDSDQ
ncbi:MAG: phosphate-starvation-inducible PsiE family protein [Xanthomonadales bacterium]|nr:phosphate-starvation-inducible PsiE family protein [Xanthomonadales bacterium]